MRQLPQAASYFPIQRIVYSNEYCWILIRKVLTFLQMLYHPLLPEVFQHLVCAQHLFLWSNITQNGVCMEKKLK